MAAQIRRDDVPLRAKPFGYPIPVTAVIAPAMEQHEGWGRGITPIDIVQPQALREEDPRGRADGVVARNRHQTVVRNRGNLCLSVPASTGSCTLSCAGAPVFARRIRSGPTLPTWDIVHAAWFSRSAAVFQTHAIHGFDLTFGPYPDKGQPKSQTARAAWFWLSPLAVCTVRASKSSAQKSTRDVGMPPLSHSVEGATLTPAAGFGCENRIARGSTRGSRGGPHLPRARSGERLAHRPTDKQALATALYQVAQDACRIFFKLSRSRSKSSSSVSRL